MESMITELVTIPTPQVKQFVVSYSVNIILIEPYHVGMLSRKCRVMKYQYE